MKKGKRIKEERGKKKTEGKRRKIKLGGSE